MIKRRHPHFTNVLSRFFTAILPIVFIFFINISSSLEEDLSKVSSDEAVILLIFGTLFAILAIIFGLLCLGWRFTYVSAENDTLLYESGIINKKKVSIPFSKINTIDLGRNLFQRIVGTCKLKLDTGAMTSGTAKESEMDLVFSLKDAESIRSYILARRAGDEQALFDAGEKTPEKVEKGPNWCIRASFGDFFMYGLTSSSAWTLLLMIISALLFISQLSDRVSDMIFSTAEQGANAAVGIMQRYSIIVVILGLLGAFVAYVIVANLWSILLATFRFYDFRAARDGRNIVIRYGLVSLKSYTLPVANIHAVTVKQNLLQQLLGRASIEVTSIGYGNEKDETSLLFPIVKLSRLEALLGELLPEYKCDFEYTRASKRSVPFFIVRPLILLALLYGAALCVLSLVFETVVPAAILAGICFAVNILSCILSYKHAAFGYSSKNIAVCSGGIRYTRSILLTDAVQSVRSSAGPFARRMGVRSYTLQFHAPLIRSFVQAKYMPDDCIEEVGSRISAS